MMGVAGMDLRHVRFVYLFAIHLIHDVHAGFALTATATVRLALSASVLIPLRATALPRGARSSQSDTWLPRTRQRHLCELLAWRLT